MYVYELQYINFINIVVYNKIKIIFLIIDLAVDIIQKIINNFIIMQMRFKCD